MKEAETLDSTMASIPQLEREGSRHSRCGQHSAQCSWTFRSGNRYLRCTGRRTRARLPIESEGRENLNPQRARHPGAPVQPMANVESTA